METMEYSEVSKSPNLAYSSFKDRASSAWLRSKRSANWAWRNTHFLVKVGVALLLFGSLVLAIAIAATDVTRSSGHGIPCSSSSECDSEANLECKNSRCECIQPKSGKAVYEPSYFYKGWFSTTWGRCAIQNGGYCSKYENYPCAADSHCDFSSSSHQCRCNSGLYFNKLSQTCIPQGRYGESCKSEQYDFCQFDFSCIEGHCLCDPESKIYDPETGKCIIKAGKYCDWQKCVPGATCINRKCVCPNDLQASSDGRRCIPFLKPGENCWKTVRCGQDDFSGLQLSCLDGKCDCDPATSVLEHQSCLPKAGQPCVHGECFSDSFCDKPLRANSGNFGKTEFACKCKDGKVADGKTGLCVIKHKGTCSADSECGHLMACKDSVCRCAFGFLVFDAGKNQCLKKVDAKCDRDREDECAGKAVCYRDQCSCQSPNKETAEGFCVSSEGQDCKWNEDCLQEELLLCSKGVCRCPNMTVYHKDLQTCVGVPTADCTVDGNNGTGISGLSLPKGCVDNAECKEKREGHGRRICQCKNGYYASSDGCQR